MATQKCTHKGCEKTFTDPNEPCHYHPGAPIFHEGQKGWQCCKPRVLTFEEFLTIPPCTAGKHSTDAPVLAPAQTSGPGASGQKHTEVPPPPSETEERKVRSVPTATATPPPQPKPEKPLEQDPEGITIPKGTKCKRLACKAVYPAEFAECEFHPGVPIFHEGSKGYTCCKRRVLEFDEFLKISGCETNKHCFIGEPKSAEEEELVQCRHDFYQTYTDVIVSVFAKKVDKEKAKIDLKEKTMALDLPMPDKKRFNVEFPLYGPIVPAESSFMILGTKVELKLKKADTISWPTLRSDEATGEIIQIGKPAIA